MTLAPTQNPARPLSSYLFPALALMAVTLIVYWPAITGGFVWDDPEYVVNNLTLRSFHGLQQIWMRPSASPQYYPLVFTSFWLEYHLWQLAPLGFHLDNVLLHLGAAMLVWRLCDRLNLRGGFLAAAIFALHPVGVESAAWISERKNVLSTVFYLSALLIFLRESHGKSYWLSLLFFIAALLSKSVTATWPAAVLVILWWRHGRVSRTLILKLIPFFALGLISIAFTAHLEQTNVGANQIVELQFTVAQRILIAGRAFWFYLGKLFWPRRLAFVYPKWSLDTHHLLPWTFPIAAIIAFVVLCFIAFRRRWPLAAGLLYVGTLLPALGLVSVYPMRYSFVADHFQYLASVAVIILFSTVLWQFARRWSLIIVFPLAWLTYQRATMFHDAETLWRDTLAKNPNSWMVNTNLANTLVERDQMAEASGLYLRALALDPERFETHANAGIAYSILARYDDATAELRMATQMKPDFAPAYFTWGQVLQQQNQPEPAIEKFRKAVLLRPDYAKAWLRLGYLLKDENRSGAIDAYQRAAQLDPSDHEAQSALKRLSQK